MTTALYGGTFNPPHIGHYSAVKTASRLFDKVIVMPSATPPHKPLPSGAPPDNLRLEMTRLTFRGFENVEVSDFEIKKGGVCRTADTLRHFDNVTLIIGTDMLKSFEQWFEFKEIFRLAEIAVLPRDEEQPEEHARRLRELYGARIRILEHSPIDISSSRIRSRFKGREKALEMIHPDRMEHSLASECEAVKLAARWGEDAAAGWAALLHDCTKHWTTERHLQFCKDCNIILDSAIVSSPKLLHGLTAAAVAEVEFNAPPDIAEAIRRHTLGCPGMTALEKILYIADKTESVRSYKGVETYRALAYEDMDAAMLELLNRNIIKLINDKKLVHKTTLDARNFYLRELELRSI